MQGWDLTKCVQELLSGWNEKLVSRVEATILIPELHKSGGSI